MLWWEFVEDSFISTIRAKGSGRICILRCKLAAFQLLFLEFSYAEQSKKRNKVETASSRRAHDLLELNPLRPPSTKSNSVAYRLVGGPCFQPAVAARIPRNSCLFLVLLLVAFQGQRSRDSFSNSAGRVPDFAGWCLSWFRFSSSTRHESLTS